MRTFLGIVFGVDMFDCLVWFVLLTIGFWLDGMPIPNGYESLIAVGVAFIAAHLPDFDLLPFKLIRKNKTKLLLLLGSVGCAACMALALWFGKQSFLWLGIVGLFGTITAIVEQQKVKDRASHWPIWHHPIPVIAICFGLVWVFASDFAPQHLWYYELLVVPLVVAHFLHDGLQPQGLAFLAPFTDTHYQWKVPGFERIPPSATCEHYRQQAERARSESSKGDFESRVDKVTSTRVILFFIAGSAVLATLLFL